MLDIRNNNKLSLRIIAFIIGFLLNIFGNSLAIVSDMGAEPWAAAAVNIQKAIGFTVGTYIFIFCIINAIFNQLLLKKLDIPRFVEEIIYSLLFSALVDVCNSWLIHLGIHNLGSIARGFLAIVGVTLFCIAISIYQRANIFMHPNDDTSNLIRFKFLGGSALKSQIADIMPSLCIIGITFLFNGHIYDFWIGTIYSIIANGIIVGQSDKWIWPKLRHNKRKHHKYI